MHRISRSLLALSASLLVSLSLHAAPPSMTTSTETVTVSTPGVVTFPSGRQLTQAFTAAERASTVPIIAGQIGWETDTGLVYRATGTNAGDWMLSLQPLNGGLTAIAALTSTEFGRSLLELPNASTLVASLSLGPLSTYSFSASRKLLTSSSLTTTPTESTISQIMDWTSSTQGSIWYRGATGWGALAPGTAGQVLTSGGSGANPSFTSPSSGITIGTTTANGTAGRVLYTDGSNVQQYATTGTGDVVRGTSPTITGLAASSITGTALTLAGGTLTGPLTVDGSTDAIQMTIQGHSTQTNPLFLVEKSDGTDLLKLANDGKITLNDGATIHNNTADTLAFVVAGQPRMTIFGSLGFILTGTDYHDSYTGSQYSSSGSSRDVHFRATSTGIWEQIKSGTQQYYRVFASDATKYLQITHDGTNAVITPSSGGVSLSGEIFLNLPTSAGTTGSLWNDGGTVKVAP